MESWSFEVLGGVSAHCGSHRLNDLVGKKPGAVLALLALTPGRTRSREEVIDLVWPDVDLNDARNRFKQILHGLRRQLEPSGTPAGSVLIADRTQVGIVAGHVSDAAQFQQALRSAAVAAEPSQQAQHLRTALALYKGELAPGFYLDALLTERQRLAALAEGAQQKLALLETVASVSPAASAPNIPLLPPFVPAQDRFFGRQNERKNLKKLIERNRLVTILGPGGIGKTRLAQKMAQAVTLEEKTRFVPLATLQNGENISDVLVAALDLPPSSEVALVRLKTAFAQKETLLVFDNIEHLLDSGGSEAIASLLESLPNVRILVTSRIRTNLPQECLYPLESLSEEDAVALFIDRAQLTRFDFAPNEENTPTIRELCRHLDGLPLAIELAAARIAILTPSQILERLNRRFDLLTDKRKDREERHRSLRATLDWGWGLLSPEVQRFFTQISLFRGSFSLEAVEAITGEPLAMDYLQNLLEASFLSVEMNQADIEEYRFFLLETLREYGLEKLEKWNKKDKEYLFDKYGNFFIEKAKALRLELSEGMPLDVIRRFKKDNSNFLAVIDIFIKYNLLVSVDICLRINIFWIYSFSCRENIIYLEKVLNAYVNSDNQDDNLMAGLYDVLGLAYNCINMQEESYKYAFLALKYARNHMNQGDIDKISKKEWKKRCKRLAGALHNLSLSPSVSLENQKQFLLEAVVINRQIGNNSWLALNYSRLYYFYSHLAFLNKDNKDCLDYLHEASGYANEAVILSKNLKSDFYLPHHLSNLSSAFFVLDRESESLKYLYESFLMTIDSELRDDFARNLLKYYCFALKFENFEIAIKFLGAEEDFVRKWDVDIEDEKTTYLYGTLQPLRDTLPQNLGQERYEALYQEGLHATIDTIKGWVATMHAVS